MSIPTYLPFTVVAGCVATIVAAVIGVDRALKRSNWISSDRTRTVQATAALLGSWFAFALALAILGVYSAATSRIPTIQFGIAAPILIGCLMIWRWPAVSRLIDAVPQQWVIAIQFYRLEGVTFLVPFCPPFVTRAVCAAGGRGRCDRRSTSGSYRNWRDWRAAT